MPDTRATRLRQALTACPDVDSVARVVLEDVLAMPDVVRAGLALVAPGGRQHHFLPSDADRLRSQPEWCLIDAYDDLPLNECIRTGRPVLHGSLLSLARVYPRLAEAQAETGIRSVCAAPLTHGAERIGGLLLYLGVDLAERGPAAGPRLLDLVTELAQAVAEALVAVRPAAEWPSGETSAGGPTETDSEVCALPSDATAPSVARRWLLDTLADHHLDRAVVDAALLCTSELVTNVVMHTGRPSVVSVEHDDEAITVRLRHMTDPTPRRIVHSEATDPLRISGHGLELVDALSTAWGSEEHAGVVTAWCRLDVAGRSPA
jgi:anti-sigma regulatory factor (Ser/Thr protein kinase)